MTTDGGNKDGIDGGVVGMRRHPDSKEEGDVNIDTKRMHTENMSAALASDTSSSTNSNASIADTAMSTRTSCHDDIRSQAMGESDVGNSRRIEIRKSRRALREESKRQLEKSTMEGSRSSRTRARPSRRHLMASDDSKDCVSNAGVDPDDTEELGAVIGIPIYMDSVKNPSLCHHTPSPSLPVDPTATRSRSQHCSRDRSSGRRHSRVGSRARSQHQRTPSTDDRTRSRSRTGMKSGDTVVSGQARATSFLSKLQEASSSTPARQASKTVFAETNASGILNELEQVHTDSKRLDRATEQAVTGETLPRVGDGLENDETKGNKKNATSDEPSDGRNKPESATKGEKRSGSRDRRPDKRSGSRESRDRRPGQRSGSGDRRPDQRSLSRESRDRRPNQRSGSRDRRPDQRSGSRENRESRDRRPDQRSGSRDRRPDQWSESRESRDRRPDQRSGSRDRRPDERSGSLDRRPDRRSGGADRRPDGPSGSLDCRPDRRSGSLHRRPDRRSVSLDRRLNRRIGSLDPHLDRLTGSLDCPASRSSSRDRNPPRTSSRHARMGIEDISRDPISRSTADGSSREGGERSRGIVRRTRRLGSGEQSCDSQQGIKSPIGAERQPIRMLERRPSEEETIVMGNRQVENEARREAMKLTEAMTANSRPIANCMGGRSEARRGSDEPRDSRRPANCGDDRSTNHQELNLRSARRHKVDRGEKELQSSEHSISSGKRSRSRSSHNNKRRDSDDKRAKKGLTQQVTSVHGKTLQQIEFPVSVTASPSQNKIHRVSVNLRYTDRNITCTEKEEHKIRFEAPLNEAPAMMEARPAATLVNHLERDQNGDSQIHIEKLVDNQNHSTKETKGGTVQAAASDPNVQRTQSAAVQKNSGMSDSDFQHPKGIAASEKEQRKAARKARREKKKNLGSLASPLPPSVQTTMTALLGMVGSMEEVFKTDDAMPVCDVLDAKPKGAVAIFQSLSTATSNDTKQSMPISMTQNERPDLDHGIERTESLQDPTDDLALSLEKSCCKKNPKVPKSLRHLISQIEHAPHRRSSTYSDDKLIHAGLLASSSIRSKIYSGEADDDGKGCLPPPSLAGDISLPKKLHEVAKDNPVGEGDDTVDSVADNHDEAATSSLQTKEQDMKTKRDTVGKYYKQLLHALQQEVS